METRNYVLRDGDRGYWIHVDTRRDILAYDGEDWLLLEGSPIQKHRGWRFVPAALGDPVNLNLSTRVPPARVLVGYKLSLKVEGYPETLTREEFERRTDEPFEGEENEDYDSRVAALYDPVYGDRDVEFEAIDLAGWIYVDGAPPPNDGHVWVAALPAALREAPEYAHLFAGYIPGFRESCRRAFLTVDGVDAYEKPHGLDVLVKVDLPRRMAVQFEHVPKRAPRRQSRVSEMTEKITRRLSIRLPDRIEAENRAAAVAEWEKLLAEVVEYVTGIVSHVCPTCAGHGWLEGAEHDAD